MPVVNIGPSLSGGASVYHVISAASTNAAAVKASKGQVYGWDITNVGAAVRYVKVYDKATAPTVGTDVPVLTIGVPVGGRASIEAPTGIQFSNGIAIAITVGIADTDSAAVGANEVAVNLFYK